MPGYYFKKNLFPDISFSGNWKLVNWVKCLEWLRWWFGNECVNTTRHCNTELLVIYAGTRTWFPVYLLCTASFFCQSVIDWLIKLLFDGSEYGYTVVYNNIVSVF